MTDERQRYLQARENFKRCFHFNEVQELLDAGAAVFEAAERKTKETQQTMDELRPIWAQGFSSDSAAAQANGTALAQLWALLQVDNQTDAVEELQKLIESSPQ